MSIAEFKPRAEYIGADNLNEYSFDFKITNVDQIITRITGPLFDLICEVRGIDFVFVQGITYDAVLGKGVVSLTANLATNYNLTILLAPDAPIQTTEFRNKSDFTLRRLEQALDVQMSAIQRLSYSVQRALKLSDNIKLDSTFSPVVPVNTTDTLIQDNRSRVLQVNATNDGFELGQTQAQQVESLAALIEDIVVDLLADFGGLPVGGDQFAHLEKQSSANGDALWTDPIAYDGISARFGNTLFQKSGLKNVLDEIIKITYTPPGISLSGSSNVLREKGASVASITLTATLTKFSSPIAEVEFYQGVTQIGTTQTSGGGIPNGGTNTETYSTPFTDNISFSARTRDVTSGVPGAWISASTSYSFVYPYYYGGGAAALGAGVAALTKHVTNNTNNYSQTITATAGQKLYVAFPASYGTLTSILDVSNFEVISAFTATTANITGLDGNAVSYRIYESNSAVVAGSYFFQFKK